ncbi:hypothetical protein GCM10027074_05200 [Streptomyces deserti]
MSRCIDDLVWGGKASYRPWRGPGGVGRRIAGQADHPVARVGQQGGEQAVHTAGTEDGHGETVRHGRHPFVGRPRVGGRRVINPGARGVAVGESGG